MKSFIALLALVAAVAADVSHIIGPDATAQVLKQNADVLPDKYQYEYETSNGIAAQESGVLENVGREDEGIAAQGAFRYTAPNGQQIIVTYTADGKNGFVPQGDHLPTPPAPEPIPEYIQRAIAYIQANAKPEPNRF